MIAEWANITLVGTAHVSEESVKEVQQTILKKKPKVIAVELCPSRYEILTKGKKWDEFSEVVDRLNSSYLISKYLVNNFEFVYHSGTTPYSPRYFFKIKKGDCKDFAKFAVYCLRRAGYDAKYTRIGFGSRKGAMCSLLIPKMGSFLLSIMGS